MGKAKKMHSKLYCDQAYASWFKMGEPISGVRSIGGGGGENLEFLENSKKHL